MGILDILADEGLNLSDEVRARLRSEAETEQRQNDEEKAQLRARARRDEVDGEVTALSAMGFEEAPGALAFYRHVQLSDDGEPGIVLLTDADMGLSGDDATGTTSRQPMSSAAVLKKFVELLPKNEEGKLAVKLSDQALAANAGNPPPKGEGEPGEDSAAHRAGAEKVLGRTISRDRSKRYRRGGLIVPAQKTQEVSS